MLSVVIKRIDNHFDTMTYTVETLSDKASCFEFDFYKLFKYTANDIPAAHPLPNNDFSRFTSVVMPRAYEQIIESIWNLNIYEDDTWVISYAKCGTTWTQEAVWQICHGVDIDGKGKESIRQRFPYLEIQAVSTVPDRENSFEFLNKLKRPRFLKTHLPICFLPKQLWAVKPKIVYVAREPKDAAVSFYHHYYNLYKYSGTMEEFLDLYLKGTVVFGSYWDHIEQFHLLQPHYPNIKFIIFENLKRNLGDILTDLCKFLNKRLTDEQIQQLINHLQFHKMKANPAINPPYLRDVVQKHRPGSNYTFVRRGDIGSHKDEMPQEYIKKFNDITIMRLQALSMYQRS